MMNVGVLKSRILQIATGVSYEYPIDGDYVRVRAANVTLTIETDNNDVFDLDQGDEVFLKPFTRLRIKHNGAGEQVITVIVGKGGSRAGSSKVGGSVTLSNAAAVNGIAAQGRLNVTNGIQVILAANSARRYLLIQNNDGAAVLRLTIDGTAPSATNGFRLAAGGSLDLSGFCVTGSITGFMETATATAGNVEFASA